MYRTPCWVRGGGEGSLCTRFRCYWDGAREKFEVDKWEGKNMGELVTSDDLQQMQGATG